MKYTIQLLDYPHSRQPPYRISKDVVYTIPAIEAGGS